MVAHLLKQSHVDCNAFLGGILKNYDSNLMLSDKSDLTVIEADEFDRSFHWLKPYMPLLLRPIPITWISTGLRKPIVKVSNILPR